MTSNSEIVSSRNIGLDIVKSTAIFFVVGVHFFLNTRFYSSSLNSINLTIQLFIQQLFLTCIPLFLMSTGYLNNHTEINKNYFKKIIPVILIYILYSIFALIYRYNSGNVEFSVALWLNLISIFKGNTYSWYINLYFGLFLIAPFLNKLYFSLDNKSEKRTLILILAILSIFSADLPIPDYWAKVYPLAYFYIGKYFREFKPEIKLSKNLLYLFIILTLQVTIEYIFADGGKYIKVINHYSSTLRSIEACLVFSLLYTKHIKNTIVRKFITDISSITLDIYLASNVTDKLMYKYIKTFPITQEQFFYLFIPLVATSFFSAYIIAKIRTNFIKVEQLINKV